MRRPARRALLALALLTVPALLAPSASAAWTSLHRFGSREGRAIHDWSVDSGGNLTFATVHEERYLLLDRIDGATAARESNLVRTSETVQRAAVVAINGTTGVLYSAWPDRTPVAGESPGLWFARRVNETSVATMRLAGEPILWTDVVQDARSGAIHVLEGSRVRVFSPAGVETGGFGIPAPEGASGSSLYLAANGDLHGVHWGMGGAYYAFANATSTALRRLSTFWDYQHGRVTATPSGEVGVLLADRREFCDLSRGMPPDVANWTTTQHAKCPLAIDAKSFGAFNLVGAGFGAAVPDGFWTGIADRRTVFTCSKRIGAWTIGADGSEYLVGDGPSVWRKLADPEIAFEIDPDRSAPTGLAVAFTITTDVEALEGAEILWHFGDGPPEKGGATMRHPYLKPGRYNVTLEVKNDPCLDGRGLLATLPFEATGSDLSAEASALAGESDGEDEFDAEALNDSLSEGDGGIPAPGAGALALAALAAALVLRRRR